MTDRVVVSETKQDLNLNTGKANGSLGVVVSREYQGENVIRHSFLPMGDVGREMMLGPTTKAWSPISHDTATELLFQRGYELRKHLLSRGGSQFWGMFVHPDRVFHDPITWDGRGGSDLLETVIVTNVVRPGKGIGYQRGYYRLVCTNGLIAKALDLGGVRFSHLNFDVDRLVTELWGPDVVILTGEDVQTGGVVGNKRGIQALIRLYESKNTKTAEEIVNSVPKLMRPAVNQLLDMPKWYTSDVVKQFEMMVNADLHPSVLDLACAFTNVINAEREDEVSVIKPLTHLNSQVQSASLIIGANSL